MSVRLTVRNGTVTNGMKRYAEDKADRLRKFFDGIRSIEVILGTEGLNKRAEIVMTVAKGETIAVHSEHEQMNAAIDMVLDRAERSIVRHKEKLREHRAQAPDALPPATDEPEEPLESYQDIIERTEFPQ